MLEKVTSWLAIEGQFWFAVLGAAAVKLIFSERTTITKAFATGFAAAFSAWAFTRPTLHFFGLAADDYTIPAAVLWTLLGENIMRSLIRRSGEKDFLSGMIALWRGK